MSQDSFLEVFVENIIVADDVFDWLKNWEKDLTGLKKQKRDEEGKYVVSAGVVDLATLDTLLVVINASYSDVAVWQVNGVIQPKQRSSSSNQGEDLKMAVTELVEEFTQNPRNKLFVGSEILLKSASYELQKKIKIDHLRRSIKKYINGKLTEADEEIYDAAVAVCGELARLCFAPDQEEVDYEISWSEDGKDYVAEIRPT
jgi:hypothetical protein